VTATLLRLAGAQSRYSLADKQNPPIALTLCHAQPATPTSERNTILRTFCEFLGRSSRRQRIIWSECRLTLHDIDSRHHFGVARQEKHLRANGLEKSKSQFALRLTLALHRRFRRPVSLP
jgi:hypothetical protein